MINLRVVGDTPSLASGITLDFAGYAVQSALLMSVSAYVGVNHRERVYSRD
jgi:hypothetical protein